MEGLNRFETFLLTATGLVVVVALLALGGIGVPQIDPLPVGPAAATGPRPRTGSPADFAPPRVSQRGESNSASRRAIERMSLEHEQLTLPFRENALSSVVKTVVPPGDSLVMGGYPLADGRHEFTFVTPRTLGPGDGGPAVMLETRVVAVAADDLAALGMDTLASRVRNSLQHAETWQSGDVAQTLADEWAETLAAPALTASGGGSFEWSLGEGPDPSFRIEGRAEAMADGSGTLVEAAVVRREPEP